MSHGADSIFFEEVLRQFLARMHRSETNNYDAARFSFDGVDRSSVFNLEYHKQNLSFFIANWKRFEVALSLFEDKASRTLFLELILFRLAGHLHVKLPTNTPHFWQLRDEAFAIPSSRSRFEFKSKFGPLRHFEDLSWHERMLALDCWPDDIAATFFIRQYHFERNNVRIAPAPGDYVIDAGSCFGDGAVAFAAMVGSSGHVYAFDPLQTHAKIIRHNIAQNNCEKTISFFPVGLGAQANSLPGPVGEKEMVNPAFGLRGDLPLPIRTIDELVAAHDIRRVDFVKMDIEGAELAALQGAEQTLRQYKPKLAISIYHRFGDYFEIPSYLQGLNLGYRFFLDHYTIHAEETVLFAIAA